MDRQLKTDVETVAATPAPAGSGREAVPTPGLEHPGRVAPVAAPRESRFSRTAIWGAFCLGLAVLGVAAAILVAGRS